MKSFSIEELNELLNGELIGSTTEKISEPEEIESAKTSSITFIGSKKYLNKWNESKASAAVINKNIANQDPGENRAFIVVDDADLAMVEILKAFAPPAAKIANGIHPSAVVEETAIIGNNVTIGANSYIGANTKIGDGCIIYPNVSILDDVTIGQQTTIKSNSVVEERCEIGSLCIIHNNVSIGADGFGYRPSADGQQIVKLPHIGNVVIGNLVEIGANSCVDRGKFGSTTVGDMTKVDNLVQIAHNCSIGRGCLIVSSTAIAGSAKLGDGVVVAGCVGIIDHGTIGAGATIGAGSIVIKDVAAGESVLGYPAGNGKEKMKEWIAIKKLAKQ